MRSRAAGSFDLPGREIQSVIVNENSEQIKASLEGGHQAGRAAPWPLFSRKYFDIKRIMPKQGHSASEEGLWLVMCGGISCRDLFVKNLLHNSLQ